MTAKPIICIVDDDEQLRDSLRERLMLAEFYVKSYASAELFLQDNHSYEGCLITDIRMPEMDGLALIEEIAKRGIELPIIVITGHGDVPTAVRAMKAGAVDFIEKPFDGETLIASVRRALDLGRAARDRAEETRLAQEQIARLTRRERSVLELLMAGQPNKIAARKLGISPRTIEVHRARLMRKMKVRSISEIVRIALAASRSQN